MTRVALLWHMHQPFYEDLVTREHIMPWVRLHALKDYYGMVALLREFPAVRATFNLVPSLLVQLEAFAADRARDRYLELGLKPATLLTEADAAFIVANFFHAQRQRMIEVYPRYLELLERRSASAAFSTDDLRDLQVWQKLAWIDPFYLTGDERVKRLLAKGRAFTEDDKGVLRTVELELLNRVIPEYRDAAARGQIEIATSPFYHPILPLLCDTDVYLRTHPGSPMPRRRFQHPEDADAQLVRAVDCHERLFGRRPVGLWPSEGSVSDAMVPLVARAGFSWMATDEQILGRSIGLTFTRDQYGHVEQPDRLYRSYKVRAGGAAVSCVFRDHVLVGPHRFRLRRVGSGRRRRRFCGPARGSRPPVRRDRRGRGPSARDPGRRERVGAFRRQRPPVSQSAVRPARRPPRAANRDDGRGVREPGRRPWNHRVDFSRIVDRLQLLDLDRSPGRPDRLEPAGRCPRGHRGGLDAQAPALEQAREELLIAEGSDWFWWYGDDHSSDHDAEFDDLFRRHLRNVYRLLHKPVPEELFVSNISTDPGRPGGTPALGVALADHRRRSDELLRMAGRGHIRGSRASGRHAPDRHGGAHPDAGAVRLQPVAPVRPSRRRSPAGGLDGRGARVLADLPASISAAAGGRAVRPGHLVRGERPPGGPGGGWHCARAGRPASGPRGAGRRARRILRVGQRAGWYGGARGGTVSGAAGDSGHGARGRVQR